MDATHGDPVEAIAEELRRRNEEVEANGHVGVAAARAIPRRRGGDVFSRLRNPLRYRQLVVEAAGIDPALRRIS